MPNVTMKELLEAGVHFGHQTRRWNPKMKRYIFGERNGIYIIDLQQTIELLARRCDFVRDIAAGGGTVLFVGTKKQAQEAVAGEGRRAAACLRQPALARRHAHELRHDPPAHRAASRSCAREKREGEFERLPKQRAPRAARASARSSRPTSAASLTCSALPARCSSSTRARRRSRWPRPAASAIAVIGLVDTNCDPDGSTTSSPATTTRSAPAPRARRARRRRARGQGHAALVRHPGGEAADDAEAETARGRGRRRGPPAEAAPVTAAGGRPRPSRSRRRPARGGGRRAARRAGRGRRGGRARRHDQHRGDRVSTTIPAKLVKELREKTGAGMMDCKEALGRPAATSRRPRSSPAQEGAGRRRQARRPGAPTRAWSAATSTPAARSAC